MTCEPASKAEVEWINYDQGTGWEAGPGNGKEKYFNVRKGFMKGF